MPELENITLGFDPASIKETEIGAAMEHQKAMAKEVLDSAFEKMKTSNADLFKLIGIDGWIK